MTNPMHRTHRTNLSDDELIICDFLWPSELRIPEKLLSQAVFPDIANIPYSHSISDDKLGEFLDSMVARQILNVETVLITTRRAEAPSLQRVFGLSGKGGLLWESERTPNWATFVNDVAVPANVSSLVLSLSESLGRSYIEACLDSGLWRLAGDIRHSVSSSALLVPWKTFESVHQLEVPLKEIDGTEKTDFSVYSARRIWWTDTKELLEGVACRGEL